jgi:hypothetical protein
VSRLKIRLGRILFAYRALHTTGTVWRVEQEFSNFFETIVETVVLIQRRQSHHEVLANCQDAPVLESMHPRGVKFNSYEETVQSYCTVASIYTVARTVGWIKRK